MYNYDEFLDKLPDELRKMLGLEPVEFGKALAERHLKMINDAVKEWAREEATEPATAQPAGGEDG